MRVLYTLAAYALLPVICLVMVWRGLRGDRGYLENFSQRFGFGPRLAQPSIWVHAVSVGEVQAAAPLVNAITKRNPQVRVVVTTVTPTGADRARALFKTQQVDVRYVPYDLPGPVRRFFDRVQPRTAVIFETEIWPNLYHECGRRKVPLILANARISPRSVGRYQWLDRLFREALSNSVVVAAQSAEDAERFKQIGADPARTHVVGNIKFDSRVLPETLIKGQEIRRRHAPDRPVWIAGSTHEGEEEAVLAAHEVVRQKHPNALLILVPRHPPRFDSVAELLEKRGARFVRHSRGELSGPETEVLLVDTLGELLNFYAASDVAFVAGSLVPIGGHNLVEPAGMGLPILTGPHNFNSQDVANRLIEQGAVEVISTPEQLGARVAELLGNAEERRGIGEIGRAAVDANRGALEKLLALM